MSVEIDKSLEWIRHLDASDMDELIGACAEWREWRTSHDGVVHRAEHELLDAMLIFAMRAKKAMEHDG